MPSGIDRLQMGIGTDDDIVKFSLHLLEQEAFNMACQNTRTFLKSFGVNYEVSWAGNYIYVVPATQWSYMVPSGM